MMRIGHTTMKIGQRRRRAEGDTQNVTHMNVLKRMWWMNMEGRFDGEIEETKVAEVAKDVDPAVAMQILEELMEKGRGAIHDVNGWLISYLVATKDHEEANKIPEVEEEEKEEDGRDEDLMTMIRAEIERMNWVGPFRNKLEIDTLLKDLEDLKPEVMAGLLQKMEKQGERVVNPMGY